MAAVQVRVLLDNEVLTQYGMVGEPFRNMPRWAIERELSICAAEHTVDEVARCVTRDVLAGRDQARWTTVGRLRSEGFAVNHRPTKRNHHHVGIKFDGDWNDEMCEAFDRAFEPETDDG